MEVVKTWGLGGILAVVALLLAIVLAVLGRMEPLLAFLIGMLALARLT